MFSLDYAAINYEKALKKQCYEKLAGVQEKYPNAVRGLGIVVGVGSFLATLIARVITSVEMPFKYLATAVAGLVKRDKSRIFIGFTGLGICLTVLQILNVGSVIASAFGIFQKTFDLAIHDKANSRLPLTIPIVATEKESKAITQENELRALPFFKRLAQKAVYDDWHIT